MVHFTAPFSARLVTYCLAAICRPVDRGGSVGSDEPPRLPNGPLEVFRKLLYWPLLTPQIAVTSSVELKTAVIRLPYVRLAS